MWSTTHRLTSDKIWRVILLGCNSPPKWGFWPPLQTTPTAYSAAYHSISTYYGLNIKKIKSPLWWKWVENNRHWHENQTKLKRVTKSIRQLSCQKVWKRSSYKTTDEHWWSFCDALNNHEPSIQPPTRPKWLIEETLIRYEFARWKYSTSACLFVCLFVNMTSLAKSASISKWNSIYVKMSRALDEYNLQQIAENKSCLVILKEFSTRASITTSRSPTTSSLSKVYQIFHFQIFASHNGRFTLMWF